MSGPCLITAEVWRSMKMDERDDLGAQRLEQDIAFAGAVGRQQRPELAVLGERFAAACRLR